MSVTFRRFVGAVAFASLGAFPLAAQQQIASTEDLKRLSIEELAQIKVTSVSKTEEPLNQAAAAVYVITQEDIRRTGANALPEILRLAPNLHVARLDANTYAISARGFNQSSGTANKLLVLIDGRPIYSPLFSGTFWDAQKTFLHDIDRIEVISGPAGALWGANAVNGVINIITKNSIQTRGWMADAHAGTLDRRLGIRGGRSLGARGSFRAYGLGMQQGAMARPDGASTDDDWNHVQGGFRADWQSSADHFTFEGDAYRGTGIGRPGILTSGSISGADLSATWERTVAGGANLRAQVYADTSRRVLISGIDARVNQYALETQYNFARRSRHAITIGAGYRMTDDTFERGPGTAFLSPAGRALHFADVFAHDAIALGSRLKLALGVKLEDNSYTGLEVMPDARLAWTVSNRTAWWAAVSRAIRTPSRFDTELINTGILAGGPDFHSEELVAYEAGYRGLLSNELSVSVSGFYNAYDDLRTVEATGPAVFPLEIRNGMRGHTYGLEAWGNLSVRSWWRVSAGLAVLRKNLELAPGSRDVFGVSFSGNDPRYRWSVRSSVDLPRDVSLDVWVRHVGRLDAPAVDAYLEADARIAWQATDTLTLSLDGQNLLHEQHLEFINPSIAASEVPRSFTLAARWTH